MPAKKVILFVISMFSFFAIFAQHPARQKIDSLKNVLPATQGRQRIDCLNALSEEYWWQPKVLPDSISCWAIKANEEAMEINYTFGIAKSNQHLGVAEIYRKNFLTAESYLKKSLQSFEVNHNDREIGWCNLW